MNKGNNPLKRLLLECAGELQVFDLEELCRLMEPTYAAITPRSRSLKNKIQWKTDVRTLVTCNPTWFLRYVNSSRFYHLGCKALEWETRSRAEQTRMLGELKTVEQDTKVFEPRENMRYRRVHRDRQAYYTFVFSQPSNAHLSGKQKLEYFTRLLSSESYSLEEFFTNQGALVDGFCTFSKYLD